MPWGKKPVEGAPEGCREVTREGLTEMEKIWSREDGSQQEPGTGDNTRFHSGRFATCGEMRISRKKLIKMIWKT